MVNTTGATSLLELINILEEHRNSIIINLKHLQENYQRKGIKRLRGLCDENGNFQEPWLTTQYVDISEYVDLCSFRINRNTATINMLVKRESRLQKVEDKAPVIELAGLLLNDLYTFNNYTVVNDGEVNIKSIKVKISSKKTFDVLRDKNVIIAERFDFRSEYEIQLDKLPLVAIDANYNSLDGLFYELAQMKVLVSIFTAHLKNISDVYLPEQLEELQKHYLSKNLYLNFPTTRDYSDVTALKTCTIDTDIRYKIDIGSRDILNLGKLMSANKFLDRMYCAYDTQTGQVFQKAIFEVAWEENIAFRPKSISARMKITAVDNLMKSIFDDFLGFKDNGIVATVLEKVGAGAATRILEDKRKGILVSKEETVTAFTAANTKLEHHMERVYRENISPLIFYIGSTGILPSGIDAKANSAEELISKYPNLQFSEDEKNGTFFEIGDSIIGVLSAEC